MLRVIPATPDLVRFLAARFSPDQVSAFRQLGGEAMLHHLEVDVRNAAHTWCAVDDGGPVFMVGALVMPDGYGAHVWYITSAAAGAHARACIRLWRWVVAEMLAEYGATRVDIPACVAAARRMQRYGFTVAAPDDRGGTMACRCIVQRDQARRSVFSNSALQMAS